MSRISRKHPRSVALAVRAILEFPHPALRRKAKKVRRIDASVQKLADDMIETLHEVGGVGLAANQIGVLQRVIVIHLPEEEEPRVYINPEIVHREGRGRSRRPALAFPGTTGS